jgi:hypothetical protein
MALVLLGVIGWSETRESQMDGSLGVAGVVVVVGGDGSGRCGEGGEGSPLLTASGTSRGTGGSGRTLFRPAQIEDDSDYCNAANQRWVTGSKYHRRG